MKTRDNALQDALKELANKPNREQAWERVYSNLWSFVLASAVRRLGGILPLAEAEDLAQESFLQLATDWHNLTLKTPDSARAYLSTVVRTKVSDRLRYLKRQRRNFYQQISLTELDEILKVNRNETEAAEEREVLSKLFAQLKPSDRTILSLILAGYTNREAATKLATTSRTIERRLRQIRERAANLFRTP